MLNQQIELSYKEGQRCYVKAATEAGQLEAIVSVFNNVDSANEMILPGAFTESLKRKLPKGVWGHDWSKPVAKTLEAAELAPGDALLPDNIKDLGGLYIKALFNLETQRGREAYSDVKNGLIDEFSIGYMVLSEKAGANGVRELERIDLYEWSPVLVGANAATATLSVKSGMGFDADTLAMEAELKRLADRVKARVDMRIKEGRQLSGRNLAILTGFLETARAALADIEALVEGAQPVKALELRRKQIQLRYQELKRKYNKL